MIYVISIVLSICAKCEHVPVCGLVGEIRVCEFWDWSLSENVSLADCEFFFKWILNKKEWIQFQNNCDFHKVTKLHLGSFHQSELTIKLLSEK
jgi:hypothetical protein